MARTNQRGRSSSNRGRNNNPEGRNQYSGMMGFSRERPMSAAAIAAAAVGAGVFLWSRRGQISDQLSNLSDQIADWREGMSYGDSLAEDDSQPFIAAGSRGRGSSQTEIAEEALTLKTSGRKARRPADPTVAEQTKAAALAD